jgi:DNA-binding response OmpR family regulator
MTIKILFVEDNAHKRGRIIDFLEATISHVEIDEAYSFASGWQKLETSAYDLVLLDMTLPTYDRSSTESGGRVRIFGGREIARKICRKRIETKIAFLTQFSSFSDKGYSYNFDDLNEELKKDLGEAFVGMIYYNSGVSTWRDELSRVFTKIGHR